jgi:hypothetical protein
MKCRYVGDKYMHFITVNKNVHPFVSYACHDLTKLCGPEVNK